jgi:ferredoxin--NADP+ reductase
MSVREGLCAGMMPGINDTLEKVAKAKGLDFSEWQGKLKKEGRFHVEVY